MKGHKLLITPIEEIMSDRKALCRIFNLAFNVKGVTSSKIIFTLCKHGKDTSHPTYIKMKYHKHDNRKLGMYISSVDVGYSDVCGLEVSVTNTLIATPSNPVKIAAIIKGKKWVNEIAVWNINHRLHRDISIAQTKIRMIETRCYHH